MGNAEDIISLLLIFVVLPAAIILITLSRNKRRHKERMALIEKGLDIPRVSVDYNPLNQVLMWGMLLAGIGFGLLLGYLLTLVLDFDKESILPILAVLFGGLGLIMYYLIKKRSEKRESK